MEEAATATVVVAMATVVEEVAMAVDQMVMVLREAAVQTGECSSQVTSRLSNSFLARSNPYCYRVCPRSSLSVSQC